MLEWVAFTIAKPKPNQSKAKGLVSPIKPILHSLYSLLLLKSAVYSARARTAVKNEIKAHLKLKKNTLVKQKHLFMKNTSVKSAINGQIG